MTVNSLFGASATTPSGLPLSGTSWETGSSAAPPHTMLVGGTPSLRFLGTSTFVVSQLYSLDKRYVRVVSLSFGGMSGSAGFTTSLNMHMCAGAFVPGTVTTFSATLPVLPWPAVPDILP